MTLRALLSVLFTLTVLSLLPGRADAHASLVSSEPADGALVPQVPSRFSLRFNEPVSPLVLRLIRPDGSGTELTTFDMRGSEIAIVTPGGLGQGTYVLSWRVVSTDGHPIGGSVVFSIGAPNAAALQSPETPANVRAAIWLTRILVYLGLFVGVGGAVFAAFIAAERTLEGRAQTVVVMAILLGLVAALVSIGLQGLDAIAAPLSMLESAAPWAIGLDLTSGTSAGIAVCALVFGLTALAVRRLRHARTLSALSLALVGVALAASGHASTADPQWLTRTAVFLHAGGLVFWIGALLPLGTMLTAPTTTRILVMNRFSRAIVPFVVTLLAAGVILAVVQVESPKAILSTRYGNILGLKLVAVLFLLALAIVNRLVLTPALARRTRGASRRLARNIAAEIVAVTLILALVASWRFTPPPRAAISAPRFDVAQVHIHSEKGMADVTLAPGRIGRTTATITLVSAAGQPLEPKDVRLVLSNPAAGVEPFEHPATRVSARGIWRAKNVLLPVPGRWQVRVDVLVTDFDKLVLEETIELDP